MSATSPAIVLVEPQLGENIGAVARAMLNCGLDDLRLVRPRDGWPSPRAEAAATGAASVVSSARLYANAAEAVADITHVYATTARPRDMRKATVTLVEAAREMHAREQRGESSAVLFGPERTGLHNDDIALAGSLLHIPLNPEFKSLNLAQAVLLVAYEAFRAKGEASTEEDTTPDDEPAATAAQLLNFFEHLEQELDATGFLRVTEKRPIMVRNLRNLFHRANLRAHEVRTLHGVVSALSGRRKDGSRVRQPRNRGQDEG